jgi:hypothetical protein
MIAAYALTRHKPRKPKRLYDRRARLMAALEKEYESVKRKGKR